MDANVKVVNVMPGGTTSSDEEDAVAVNQVYTQEDEVRRHADRLRNASRNGDDDDHDMYEDVQIDELNARYGYVRKVDHDRTGTESAPLTDRTQYFTPSAGRSDDWQSAANGADEEIERIPDPPEITVTAASTDREREAHEAAVRAEFEQIASEVEAAKAKRDQREREAFLALNPNARRPQRPGQGRLTGPLVFTTLSIVCSSFQFGYHIGCVNAPGELIQDFFNQSHHAMFDTYLDGQAVKLRWSMAVAIFAIGGMIGGLSSGWFADKMGRKGTLLFNNLFAFVAAALMSLSKYSQAYPMMILGRLIIGIHSGLASGLVPMYLTEIAPINHRGLLGSLHQLFITIAILVSQILGLNAIFGTAERWPLIFAMTVIPSLLQLILLSMCPESPKYTLVVKNNEDAAEAALKKLRQSNDVHDEVSVIREEATKAQAVAKVGMGDLFKKPLWWPMFLSIMMMLAQQLSGINAAMFFSNAIFKSAGLIGTAATYATISMGVINVMMTFVSVYLVDHPKFGRRSLLLIGLSVMFVASLAIVVSLSMIVENQTNLWSYLAILFVLLFVIGFATGPGSIPWFFVNEVFGSGARGPATSIAVMVNWTANSLVGLTFLPLTEFIQQYSFLVFSFFLVIFIVFTYKFIPETKGKTPEEVNAEFDNNRRE